MVKTIKTLLLLGSLAVSTIFVNAQNYIGSNNGGLAPCRLGEYEYHLNGTPNPLGLEKWQWTITGAKEVTVYGSMNPEACEGQPFCTNIKYCDTQIKITDLNPSTTYVFSHYGSDDVHDDVYINCTEVSYDKDGNEVHTTVTKPVPFVKFLQPNILVTWGNVKSAELSLLQFNTTSTLIETFDMCNYHYTSSDIIGNTNIGCGESQVYSLPIEFPNNDIYSGNDVLPEDKIKWNVSGNWALTYNNNEHTSVTVTPDGVTPSETLTFTILDGDNLSYGNEKTITSPVVNVTGQSTIKCEERALYMLNGISINDVVITPSNGYLIEPATFQQCFGIPPNQTCYDITYTDRFYVVCDNTDGLDAKIEIRGATICDYDLDIEYHVPKPFELTVNNLNACSGQTVTFTATPVDDIAYYQFNFDGITYTNIGSLDNDIEFTINTSVEQVKARVVDNCGIASDWTTKNFQFNNAPLPLSTITADKSFCDNGNMTLTVDNESTGHDGYLWNVYFYGATGENYINHETLENKFEFPIPNDATGASVQVRAYNNCGITPMVSRDFPAYSVPPQANSIVLPTRYTGGENNTFTVSNEQPGIEYRWTFVGYAFPNLTTIIDEPEIEIGTEIYEFTPDFRYENVRKGVPIRVCADGTRAGQVKSFSIKLDGRRAGCGNLNWEPLDEKIVNNVIYSCQGRVTPSIGTGDGNPRDKLFFIELLPNPALVHVTIKFPTGGEVKNIKIVDAYGVERKNINTTSAAEMVNISDLPFGVYTVVATQDTEIATEHLQILP